MLKNNIWVYLSVWLSNQPLNCATSSEISQFSVFSWKYRGYLLTSMERSCSKALQPKGSFLRTPVMVTLTLLKDPYLQYRRIQPAIFSWRMSPSFDTKHCESSLCHGLAVKRKMFSHLFQLSTRRFSVLCMCFSLSPWPVIVSPTCSGFLLSFRRRSWVSC